MSNKQDRLKQQVARAALDYILPQLDAQSVIGTGTGSTTDFFIDALADYKNQFRAAVASSERSASRLQQHQIAVLELNEVQSLPFYIDGADEIDAALNMIKGGGGALTREKIVASAADQFICIVDASKLVDVLGTFPLPVEVIPMAREVVARRLNALGGQAKKRANFITDNGCEILDVSGLDIHNAAALEAQINNIAGVVSCGLFALAPANLAFVAADSGVQQLPST